MSTLLTKIMTAVKLLAPYLLKLATAKKGAAAAVVATPIDLTGNLDARAWAKDWAKTIAECRGVPYDEGTMITWFSHAIMTGYDAGRTFNREYPSSEAAASVADPKTVTVSVNAFETDGASIPAGSFPKVVEHMCGACKKSFASCKAQGAVFACDVDSVSRGPHDDRVLACESFEVKA
jgi:hypothetical protein